MSIKLLNINNIVVFLKINLTLISKMTHERGDGCLLLGKFLSYGEILFK